MSKAVLAFPTKLNILHIFFVVLTSSDFFQFSSQLSSPPNHFTIILHSVPTSLSTSFVNHLPQRHSHASLFTSFTNHHIPLTLTHTPTLTHSPSFHVLLHSYLSLLSLSLHTEICLTESLLFFSFLPSLYTHGGPVQLLIHMFGR